MARRQWIDRGVNQTGAVNERPEQGIRGDTSRGSQSEANGEEEKGGEGDREVMRGRFERNRE